MKYQYWATALLVILLSSCSKKQVRNIEAIDDQSVYEKALAAKATFTRQMQADVETDPVQATPVGADAADDPAIWYHTTDPSRSRIFGTNKKKGIHSYDLQGKELQYLPYAPINNIDIRQGVVLDDERVDILAGSNRGTNSIDLFLIDSTGAIADAPDYTLPLPDMIPYGLCLYKGDKDLLYVFTNDSKGNILQLSVQIEDGKLNPRRVKRMKLPSQAEGMVADDATHKLYVSEEEKGIHIYDARPSAPNNSKLLSGSTAENTQIAFDLEGLALLPPHYLLASSQGNFSYAIFDLSADSYLSSFTITDGKVDGVEETDGIDLCPLPLGPTYPAGLLVVQDGWNRVSTQLQNQNFKYVDLRKVLELVERK